MQPSMQQCASSYRGRRPPGYTAAVRTPSARGDDAPTASSVAGRPAGWQHALAFGSQLRRLRLKAGLTRDMLAERAGLGTATLAALERGERQRPHTHTVVALAEALRLDAVERTALLEVASGSSAVVSPDTVPEPPPPRIRLPVPPTELIGREADVAATAALLEPARSRVRLLTLVGPGGVGKTRLALAAAGALADAYLDGVAFVDLAPLRDERLVPATIAHVLAVRESGGRSARHLLLDYLQERQVLLVLDNFEHLLGAAPLLAELLECCPRLALLVTSRAALHLRAEHRRPVPPLAAPSDQLASAEMPPPDAIAAAPAVRLFVERAQVVAPDFVLDAGNAPTVAAICRWLDGMPLAIELAAARVRLLRPEALLQRLERRLLLLTRGAADLPERQQTLRHTLAWSYDLLGPSEQALFRRLAVFAAGWTLEAAETVCGGAKLATEEILERLDVLVDNSLVYAAVDVEQEPRFGMLETIREYALEQLAASGEEAKVRGLSAPLRRMQRPRRRRCSAPRSSPAIRATWSLRAPTWTRVCCLSRTLRSAGSSPGRGAKWRSCASLSVTTRGLGRCCGRRWQSVERQGTSGGRERACSSWGGLPRLRATTSRRQCCTRRAWLCCARPVPLVARQHPARVQPRRPPPGRRPTRPGVGRGSAGPGSGTRFAAGRRVRAPQAGRGGVLAGRHEPRRRVPCCGPGCGPRSRG
jgi:predicted ATPase/transcriptional regulator with XRE-family HTH domain